MAYQLPLNSQFGPFTILFPLGAGGMGSVYRVRWEAQGIEVALKVIQPGQKEDAVKRFRREISATAGLAHPGIVRVLDYGEIDGAPYYAMEYLACPTLLAMIEESTVKGKAVMDLPTFGKLFRSLLDALGYAHAHRVVHRDIKPANIFLRPTGEAVIADFGVAFIADSTALTASGQAVGTPTHMAPEQIRGGAIDLRTDIYQVGLLMYQVLAGALPFMDEDGAFGVALARMTRTIPPPSVCNPTAPPQLDRVILRCLSLQQEDRYPDTTALAKDLEAAMERRAVGTVAAAGHDARLEAMKPARSRPPTPRAAPAPPAAKPRASMSRTILLAAVLNVVGFGGLYLLLGPRLLGPRVKDVRIEPGTIDAVISFATGGPSTGLVEYGTGQTPDRLARGEAASDGKHRIRLEGLSPGQDLVCRVVAETPDGRRYPGSLLHFRTLSGAAGSAPSPHRPLDVRLRTGREDLEISFATVGLVRSRLLLTGPDGKRELPVSPDPASEHHLSIHDLAPGTRYAFRIVLLPADGPPLNSLEQSVETSK